MALPRKLTARLEADQRGAALVEFSLAVPVLVSLAIGVAEFGRILHHHHVLQKAVRDAGRYLARVPIDCVNETIASADEAMAKDIAMLETLDVPLPGGARISYWTDPGTIDAAVHCEPNEFDPLTGEPIWRGGAFVPVITVSATVNYADLGMLAGLGIDPITLFAEHRQVGIAE